MAQAVLVRPPATTTSSRLHQFRLFHLGLLFLALFGLQALVAQVLDVRWEWLAQLQQGDGYAKWTGMGLAIYLGSQWLLPLFRLMGKPTLAKRFYPLHRQLGVFAPVFFFIHSMKFGYAFLLVLSVVYLANVLVGLLSVDVVKDYISVNRKKYAFWWMILHVSLSFVTMSLMFYHMYVAFAFK